MKIPQPSNTNDSSVYALFLQLITEKHPISFHDHCLLNQVTEDQIQKLNRIYYVLEDNIDKQNNPIAYGGKANINAVEKYINILMTEVQDDPIYQLYESELSPVLQEFQTLLPEIFNKSCAIKLNLLDLPYSELFFYSIPALKFTHTKGSQLALDENCYILAAKMDAVIPNHALFTQADTHSFFLPFKEDNGPIPSIYFPIECNAMAFLYWFVHLHPSLSLQTQMNQYDGDQDHEREPFCSFLNNDEELIDMMNTAHIDTLSVIRHNPFHPSGLIIRGNDASHLFIIDHNSPSSDALLKTTAALSQLGIACLEFPHTCET